MLEVTRKDISFCMVGNGISALNLVLYIHEEILQGRLNIGGNRKMASLSLDLLDVENPQPFVWWQVWKRFPLESFPLMARL